MTQRYYPFDAGNGSSVLEADWQRMARRWLATGVIRGYLSQLAVTADGTALSVSVAAGGAWVEGFYYETDAAVAQTIAAADATNPRIDRVIVRLDRTANTVALAVLTGTPAASPTAPTLTQTDTLWEISLAQVRVDAAVGVIAASKVTDERTLVQNGPKPLQGLAANLPTIRQQGIFYYKTDPDLLTYDDGAATHDFPSKAVTDAAYISKAATLSASIATGETTTATAFGDLPTIGPTVGPIVTGTSALVILTAALENNTAGYYAQMSLAVSGATTLAAGSSTALSLLTASANQQVAASRIIRVNLTAGSNTFTAKYSAPTGGTAKFTFRELTVIPL